MSYRFWIIAADIPDNFVRDGEKQSYKIKDSDTVKVVFRERDILPIGTELANRFPGNDVQVFSSERAFYTKPGTVITKIWNNAGELVVEKL
jgi:hypothetical protein